MQIKFWLENPQKRNLLDDLRLDGFMWIGMGLALACPGQ
jgi:hypothetical protein